MLNDDKYIEAMLKLKKYNSKFLKEYNDKMIEFANQSFIFVEYEKAEKALKDIQDKLSLINILMIKFAHHYQVDELNVYEIISHLSKQFKSDLIDEIFTYILN